MIELKEVSAGYNGEVKVRGANLVFETGQVTSIIGPNGCGKTTLLNVIARLMRPYSGQLLVDGVDVNTIGKKRYAQMVSILPQIRTVPNITVKSLVSHGRFPYLSFPRRLSQDDVEIVEHSMEITGTMSLRNRYVAELSGGERQKVYMAMVVAQNTDMILLDEPTTFLDIGHQFEVLNLVRRLNKEGKTIVMVLHDISHALDFSDKVCLMENGDVRCIGDPKYVFNCGQIDEVFNVTSENVVSPRREHYIFSGHID